MRILWVKLGGLWPPTSGGRIRTVETLSQLSRRHDITVLTTHGPRDDHDGLIRRLPRCRVVSVPYVAPRFGSVAFAVGQARSCLSATPFELSKWRVPAIQDRVRMLFDSGDVDVCVTDFLVANANIPQPAPVPLVLFEHNIEHLIWQRLASVERRPIRKALFGLEGWKMKLAERRACLTADVVITVSDDDRARVEELAPGTTPVAIPTGVDVDVFSPGHRPEVANRLVFTGSMDWYPNEDAILHFVGGILPGIRAEIPDVSLTIVGRNPGPRLRALAADRSITVTGTVDDVRPYVDEASLYIVPLRAGGGTRLKIFEALAMGKAIVSTTVGAEGLGLVPNRHIVIADKPDEFASRVIALLRDPTRRRAIGRTGMSLVRERYSWDHVAHEFEEWCVAATTAYRERTGTTLATHPLEASR